MARDVPLLVLSTTVALYWSTIVFLVIYQRVRYRRKAGVVPKQPFERWLWLLMVPVVVSWITFPILAGKEQFFWFVLPTWATEVDSVYWVRCAAACLAVVAYLLSLYCWLLLGRNWSMAIVPKQTSELVTSGAYRWVRHPIYSLSVWLMISSLVVVPTVPMVFLALLHLVVMTLKASNEERHLQNHFGNSYVQYCQQVGRFWPRWSLAPRT
jgi:protein-S-isoprenylcysteine O-methyltransferase Ste14